MERLKSRKLWAMIVGSVFTAVNDSLMLVPAAQVPWILGLIMAYIGGQSYVDANKAV